MVLAWMHSSRTASDNAGTSLLSQRHLLAVDPYILDPAFNVKGVAGHNHHICILPDGEGTQPVVQPAMQAALMVMAAKASSSSIPARAAKAAHRGRYWIGVSGWSVQIATRTPAAASAARVLHGQPPQLWLGTVGEEGTGDHRHSLLGQKIGNEPPFGTVDDGQVQAELVG